MKKLLNSFTSIAVLTIFQACAFAQVQGKVNISPEVNSSGADILAFTAAGEQFNGELLSVRENSIMILNSSVCENNRNWWECVEKVRNADIQKLVIQGNSYVLPGLGTGVILGLISLLFTVDFNTGEGPFDVPKYNSSEGVTIGTFLGCIVAGGIIGLLASTQGEVIEPFSEYDISGLSVYAKYPGNEPPILEKIE